jgi:hypothetical protein
MAIQPIDLQTLYTQLDKISKTEVHQQQGMQLARELQRDTLQKQEMLRNETVKELRTDTGNVKSVDDEGGQNAPDSRRKKQKKEHETEEPQTEGRYYFIYDPQLGRNIDVSG